MKLKSCAIREELDLEKKYDLDRKIRIHIVSFS